ADWSCDFAGKVLNYGLRDLSHPSLVVEAVAQGAYLNGQPVTLVGRIPERESGIAQSLQDGVHGGARQTNLMRYFRDGRAVAQIQHGQRIEAAHERTDGACRFHETSI